jgi:acyl-CoA synthetase (AMP-forming)/AMP-acid ligase II
VVDGAPTEIQHPSRFARTAPDRPAVIIAGTDGNETVLTYGELDARSNQVAHALRAFGLGVGDNIAVLIDNRAEYFEVVWGAMRAGLLVTPINWHLAAEEAEYIVKDCGATALFASAACAHLVPNVGGNRVAVGGAVPGFDDYEAVLGAQPATPIADECEGNWMFYSSGTTGRPKGIKPPGVGGPLGAPTAFTGLVQGLYGGNELTRYLSPAPLYHAAPSGWSNAVHRLGGTVVTMARFDPVEFLANIERYRITLAQVVPTHLVRLLKLPEAERTGFDLSSLEKLVHAAAPCPPEVKRAAMEWLGPILYEYYSGSEGVGFCVIGPEEWLAHPGSVGRSLLGAVHILDADGNELPAREEGEVWFETASRFQYHGDPKKTAGAFNGRGWASLGDMGWVDEEAYLYLTDRVSNMIISGGVNIYPREVEDALIAHPGVADVAVIGIPDEDMGEAVRAVVQAADADVDRDVFAAELIAFSRDRVAHFKCPTSIVFVEELPRLPTGKIARRLLPPEVRA